ncbi:hypothetical protein [Haloterrigena salifodinae]|uniref:hypothetical protein n=1 Tax=Haloterrigena salifodinae TaxID=2675099 RepID=UPI001E37E216|nr:hypothetical protein [Haloterrigena salifodinae]
MLSRVQSTGQQYRVAKLLNRNDIDGSEINSRSVGEQRRLGDFTSRHGEDGVRVAAAGGEEFRDIVATGKLDSATTDRLIRAYDRELIDKTDLQRISRGLDKGNLDQAAVQKALVRANQLDAKGHEVVKVKTAKQANRVYRERDDQPPHKEGTAVIEYEAQSPERFVRVYDGEGDPGGPWVMKED